MELIQADDCYWLWEQYRQDNIVNRLITYSMLEDRDSFADTLSQLDQAMSNAVANGKVPWWAIVNPKGIGSPLGSLQKAVLNLRRMQKSSQILPYLSEVAEKCEAYARQQSEFEERDLFSLYELVAECADEAYGDTACSNEFKRECSEIESKYRMKLEAITGTTYILNWESEEDI